MFFFRLGRKTTTDSSWSVRYEDEKLEGDSRLGYKLHPTNGYVTYGRGVHVNVRPIGLGCVLRYREPACSFLEDDAEEKCLFHPVLAFPFPDSTTAGDLDFGYISDVGSATTVDL